MYLTANTMYSHVGDMYMNMQLHVRTICACTHSDAKYDIHELENRLFAFVYGNKQYCKRVEHVPRLTASSKLNSSSDKIS